MLNHFTIVAVFAFVTPLPSVGSVCVGQTKEYVHALAVTALSAIRNSEDEERRAVFMADAALVLARNDEEESAYDLFHEALQSIPEPDWGGDGLSDVAEKLATAGYCDDALAIASSMRLKEVRYSEDDVNFCLLGIVYKMAEQGRLDHATQISFEIADEYVRALALADVAVAALRTEGRDRADELARQAIFCANHVNSLNMRKSAVASIVNTFMDGQMVDVARSLVAVEVDRGSLSGWGYIMGLESQLGNVEAVKRAAGRWMKWNYSRHNWIDTNMALAEALAKAGRLEEARETLAEFVDYEYYGNSAGAVADAYIRQGRIEEALAISDTFKPNKHGSGFYVRILLDVAAHYSERGDTENTERLVLKARDHVSDLEFEGHQGLYRTVAHAHGWLGFERAAETWADSLASPEARATTLLGLASGILDREQNQK